MLKLFLVLSLLFGTVLSFSCPSHIYRVEEIFVDAKTHYDGGLSYGKKAAQIISTRVKMDVIIQTRLWPFYWTKAGKIIVDEIVARHNEEFPEYMEEMRGMADGARVDMLEIFFFTMREEFSYLVPPRFAYKVQGHCSDVLMHETVGHLVHNEDGTMMDRDSTVFLHFVIRDSERVYSNFTSYVYGAELPTAAFGYNSAFVFSMNFLQTKTANKEGLGRNFITRRIMDSRSLQSAMEIAKDVRAFVGHNYQFVSLVDGFAADLEAAPFGAYAFFTVTKGRSHFHANMYNLLMTDDEFDDSSDHRMKRAAELMPATTGQDARAILGDCEDKMFPLYQVGGHSTLYTLHTMEFNFANRLFLVYQGNPTKRDIRFQYKL